MAILQTYSDDLTGCLVNCSSKGFCQLTSNKKYTCSCQQYYEGSSCQNDIRPCSISPCLNNGLCIEHNSTLGSNYTCECMPSFYGDKCQYERDLCLNKDCSGNGVCLSNQTASACKCFQYYYGENCESQRSELTTIKTVIKLASIIAIVTIVLFYLLFVFLDLFKMCIIGDGTIRSLNRPSISTYKRNWRNKYKKNKDKRQRPI